MVQRPIKGKAMGQDQENVFALNLLFSIPPPTHPITLPAENRTVSYRDSATRAKRQDTVINGTKGERRGERNMADDSSVR